MKEKRKTTGFEIAIIGMSGGFPMARNIDEYWHNLKTGIETLSFLTPQDIEEKRIDPNWLKNPNYVPAKGCLYEEKAFFDPFFFSSFGVDLDHRIFVKLPQPGHLAVFRVKKSRRTGAGNQNIRKLFVPFRHADRAFGGFAEFGQRIVSPIFKQGGIKFKFFCGG